MSIPSGSSKGTIYRSDPPTQAESTIRSKPRKLLSPGLWLPIDLEPEFGTARRTYHTVISYADITDERGSRRTPGYDPDTLGQNPRTRTRSSNNHESAGADREGAH
ncbi:Uncharacterized protein Rs2_15682 [Raphanus sativus]|nr:Uncharacterized protein Rs2_15682 [Raphanus sativus]